MGIIPVLLCGGIGSRLWPLSRAEHPKHFLRLGSEYSLFQQTALRSAADIYHSKPIIVGSAHHGALLEAQLDEVGKDADLCLEPVGRNSCPAIIFGCLRALQREEDPLLLILPCDHLIEPVDRFDELVNAAIPVATSHLVTFGFKPDSPQTGYGYIRCGRRLKRDGSIPLYQAGAFIEKPDLSAAIDYCKKGYLWNSGMFLMNARLFLGEVQIHQPKLLEIAEQAFSTGKGQGNAVILDTVAMEAMPNLSVDQAVFENSEKVAVCPADLSWHDIGNWDRAAALFPRDGLNNHVWGKAEFRNSVDNLVHSPRHKTCLVGVSNLAVVVTHDAVLVTHRSQSEQTGFLAGHFSEAQPVVYQYTEVDHRPWGQFHCIDRGSGYQVKRLVVDPGQSLSLQSHSRRSEHWIVVVGRAEVTLGNTVRVCETNESIFIPTGSLHRLANKGHEVLILIEVQTGDYLGEDDITRFEDIYDRK